MEVVVSGAFPRFSTMNHALAVWPGRPWPLDAFMPVEPVRSRPRVLKTSICNSSVVFTEASSSSERTRDTTPDSSPSAVDGMLASKVMVCETSGTNSRVRDSPFAGANVQPSGSWSLVCARVHEAVRDPVAMTSMSTCWDVPGEIRGVSRGPVRSARYGSTTVKVAAARLLSSRCSVMLSLTSNTNSN